jgi:hypothetical protein
MAQMRPFYDEGFYRRWLADQGDRLVGLRDDFGTASVARSTAVDPAALARMAAKEPHKLGLTAPVGLISVRVLIPTPNPSNGSRGGWQRAARIAKQQREAVAAVLLGQAHPPAPWAVTLTRSSAGKLDPDNLQTALKRVRDAVAQFLLGGRIGERDNDPQIEWHCNQRPGKRGHPCVDIEIRSRPS